MTLPFSWLLVALAATACTAGGSKYRSGEVTARFEGRIARIRIDDSRVRAGQRVRILRRSCPPMPRAPNCTDTELVRAVILKTLGAPCFLVELDVDKDVVAGDVVEIEERP